MRLNLFAPGDCRDFGERVAAHLRLSLAPIEERDFEDGEHKTRALQSVRERDVYVLQSLHGETGRSANDKLVRLLFFIGSLKDAGASRVTAVLPYLCYARKDRKTKSRDPVSTRYLASLFEAVGTDRVLTLDVHNLAAYQNAFRVPTEHLEAKRLFVAHCASIDGPVSVLSPDVGGVKRAEAFREALRSRLDRDVDLAFMEKYRSAGVVSGGTLVGTVQNHTVLILDDLIASGGTLVRAARACRERGATRVIAMATHGAFSANAERVLDDTAIDSLVITDSIPVHRTRAESLRQRLVVLDTAELFAESIRRMHSGGSIVELLEG